MKLGIIAAVSDELHHDGKWIRGFDAQRLRRTKNLVAKAVLNTIADFV
ncbi:MAG: hypothetical protein QXM43_00870 [Desulfurococcaceae archaeon]